MTSNTPVIVEAVRSPQGKEDSVFADVRSEDLSIPLIDEMLDRTGLTGADVDDLLWGCAQQRGEQGNNVARVIALLSELGEETPATTINRWCASSPSSDSKAMTRATLLPCSPRCWAQPDSRSSTSAPVSPVQSDRKSVV